MRRDAALRYDAPDGRAPPRTVARLARDKGADRREAQEFPADGRYFPGTSAQHAHESIASQSAQPPPDCCSITRKGRGELRRARAPTVPCHECRELSQQAVISDFALATTLSAHDAGVPVADVHSTMHRRGVLARRPKIVAWRLDTGWVLAHAGRQWSCWP